ncbi:MAG: hypothetical protein EPO36_00130 [Chloroflexota bacterium]|nr:MAG: hypothetical protein EPO36_00130 [Chloroflexota bacterium]
MQRTDAIHSGPARLLVGLLAAALVATCGGGAVSPSPKPGATTFEEFRTAACAAWASLFEGYGNPDTNAPSDLRQDLEAAIEAGDTEAVERHAAAMLAELEAGRAHAAVGAAWSPGAEPMAAMGDVLAAFQAYVDAERAAAGSGLAEAKGAGQAAFETAGAIEAWTLLLTPDTWAEVNAARPSGSQPEPCGEVDISL